MDTSPAPARTPLDLSWSHPKGLVGLSLVNTLLRILTLGVYGFWAKTEVRKRIWSGIRLNGEPLVYTGTGWELFMGFLVVFGLFVLPTILLFAGLGAFLGPQHPAFNVILVLFYIGIFFLAGIAAYRAMRYRLARTTWRGIRGSLVGSDVGYAWTSFWTGLLVPLTLGWISPWRSTKLQKILTDDMRFGTAPFRFTGTAGPLYGPFALYWTGLIAIALAAFFGITYGFGLDVTTLMELMQSLPEDGSDPDPETGMALAIYIGALGLAFIVVVLASVILGAWYSAAQYNHFARSTELDGVNFEGNATGLGLIWLAVSNFLILLSFAVLAFVIVMAIVGGIAYLSIPPELLQDEEMAGTIGGLAGQVGALAALAGFSILTPVTQARTTRYLVEHLTTFGGIDAAKIAQGADQGIGRGEGLAQAFDIDAF